MLLHITEQSRDTLQEQILKQIRARILSGELGADQPLPSIRSLARQLQVSVITVQRAYEALMHAELIYSRRGKGFFVAAMADKLKTRLARERFSERLGRLLDEARRDGLSEQEIRDIFRQEQQAGSE